MESAMALLVGIGLAASCGFRVFVPILVASIAAYSGYLHVASGFEWLGTQGAILAFSVATALEIGAYYIPWLDNVLDTVASPCAIVAGVILCAACVADLSPFLQWSLAAIAGGGSAGVVQGGSVASRLASTTTTGGIANGLVATLETVFGFVFSAMSILVPVVAILLLVIAMGLMYYQARRLIGAYFHMRPSAATPPDADD